MEKVNVMKKWVSLEVRTLFLIVLLIIGLQVPIYYFSQQGEQGWMFIFLLIGLVIFTLLAGTIGGLFGSLVMIFILGSFIFYIALPNSALNLHIVSIPLQLFLLYGISLLVLVIIAGTIHRRIRTFGREKFKLQEEIRQFVAVDRDTGFDNKFRMLKELESEMSRTRRYGGVFTLVLLQMDYYKDFARLYGVKEQRHLLQSIAEKIRMNTRSTDLKFHYEADRFGILLTNTGEESIDIVYEKLAKHLTTHVLLNGKQTRLRYRIGHIAYDQQSTVETVEAFISQVEREMVTREL